ncbi:MAG: SsrA-binding protein [Candidatus Saccharimonadales bacterium]
MKKKQSPEGKIRNKRARFDYELGDSFLMGMVLNGRETKSLRLGHGQLQGAYVTVKEEELYLINASIHGTKGIPIEDLEVTQARKLLAKRKEIDSIIAAKKQGITVVPTEILTRGRYIKLRVSLGKGKKHSDKRQTIKKRDDSRSAHRELKYRN